MNLFTGRVTWAEKLSTCDPYCDEVLALCDTYDSSTLDTVIATGWIGCVYLLLLTRQGVCRRWQLAISRNGSLPSDARGAPSSLSLCDIDWHRRTLFYSLWLKRTAPNKSSRRASLADHKASSELETQSVAASPAEKRCQVACVSLVHST